jgi:hypothetical protein
VSIVDILYICMSTTRYSISNSVIWFVVVTKERKKEEGEKKEGRMFDASGDTPLLRLCCFCLSITKVVRMILWLQRLVIEKQTIRRCGYNNVTYAKKNVGRVAKKNTTIRYLEPSGSFFYDTRINITHIKDIQTYP